MLERSFGIKPLRHRLDKGLRNVKIHHIKSLILIGILIGLIGVALSTIVKFFTGFSIPTYIIITLVSVTCGLVAKKKIIRTSS